MCHWSSRGQCCSLALASRQGASSSRISLFELENRTSGVRGRDKEIIEQKPLLWHPVGFSSAQYQAMLQPVWGSVLADTVMNCGLICVALFCPSGYLSETTGK